MWAFLFRRQTQMETDIKRILYEIEGIKRDAIARGVLLNEIYQEQNNGDRAVRHRGAASEAERN